MLVVQRVQVSSSAIASVGFDPPSNTLEVTFTSGRVYRYFSVPRSVVDAVLGAESVGAAFNRLVRDRYPATPVSGS